MVKLSDLTIDPEIQLQTRGIDAGIVGGYVEAIASGAEFPPVKAFSDNGTFWLWDGFHRVEACRFLGFAEIEADIQPGTYEDAMVHAAIANVENGRPMNRAQKEEAGKRLLRLTDWSNAKIARELAVDPKTITNWAASIENSIDRDTRTVTRGGTTYAMDVSNIGSTKQKERTIDLGEITDDEILRIARDGGRQLCDHALQKWIGNAYNMDEATRQAYINRWKEIKSRISDVRDETASVHYSSQTSEWFTPPLIIERVLKVMGEVDLDPCSNSHETPNVPAAKHFTKEDNGLSQTWHGRVYMNPPYGREIANWVNYLCKEYEQGDVSEAIALLPARTDTEWFRRLRQYPRCFIWGRLRFSGNETGAPFPSMAVYLGGNISRFKEAFGSIGDIYVWSPTEISS